MRTMLLLTGSLLFVLSGCTVIPQTVHLDPKVPVAPSEIGRGHTIYLRVLDQRPSTVIGYRGNVGQGTAPITGDAPADQVLSRGLAQGLSTLGFTVRLSAPTSKYDLRVDINLLQYTFEQGFLANRVRFEGTAHISADSPAGFYENIYRAHQEVTSQAALPAAANEKLINDGFAELVSHMLEDPELIRALSTL